MPASSPWHASLTPEPQNLPLAAFCSEIKMIPGSAALQTAAELLLLAGRLPLRVWLQLFPVTSLKLAFFFSSFFFLLFSFFFFSSFLSGIKIIETM